MKQFTTKEQWNELNKLNRRKLREFFGNKIYIGDVERFEEEWFMFSIGQIIEFLGESLYEITHSIINKNWYVKIIKPDDIIQNEELCDALWVAVKYKLIINEK